MRTFFMRLAVWQLALAWALPFQGASAENCAPVARATIALGVEHRAAFVPMTVNGTKAAFLLDTGAERTVMSDVAARRFGLATHSAYGRPMSGVGGAVATAEVHLDRATLGSLSMPGFFLLAGPLAPPSLAGVPADGLLGADVLAEFDLDVDLIDRKLTLYAPLDCEHPALPGWRAPRGLPARLSLHRHLVFDVTIGGQTLPAFIDTGAQVSFIEGAAAKRLGLTWKMLEQDPRVNVAGLGPGDGALPMHRFDAVTVAGQPWTGPVLVVAPLGMQDTDVILGADFLESHRVWLSYQARRVFLAPAD
jgi:predicted aspartyl protease